MVWCVLEPNGLGGHVPDGDDVGWRERLTKRFHEEMSGAERASHRDRLATCIARVCDKFKCEPGAGPGDAKPVAPVAESEQPTDAPTVESCDNLAALVTLTARLLAVDET